MAGQKEEEVWRLPNASRGEDVRFGGGSYFSAPLSGEAKARLARIVRRAPEVVVKVTGRTRGVTHLKAHLDYTTRNGRLLAETQDGEQVQDRGRLRELRDEWLLANAAEARGRNTMQGAQSVGLILSMPPGAPPDRVHDAARSWAIETFKGTYDWIMVRHDDQDHPHVHISVRAVGSDGRRLAPGPEDLQVWRERFARELRRLGVQAEATPRQARGLIRRSERTQVHQLERRGAEPNVRKFQRIDVLKSAKAHKALQLRGWQRSIQRRQERIREAYLAHASTLADGDADDRSLARDIQRFVAGLPVPLTRRQRLTVELRASARSGEGAVLSHPPKPVDPKSTINIHWETDQTPATVRGRSRKR